MYPQSDAEALFLQSLRKSVDIGKLDGIKLGGAVTGLPVIVNLDLTILESMGDDFIRVSFYHFRGDIGLVSGPGRPYRIFNHQAVGVTRRPTQMLFYCVLMSSFRIRKKTYCVCDIDDIAMLIGRFVLGDHA